MYGLMAAMGAAIALLWSSTPVALAEARERWRNRPPRRPVAVA
jgi:hypothetical protein